MKLVLDYTRKTYGTASAVAEYGVRIREQEQERIRIGVVYPRRPSAIGESANGRVMGFQLTLDKSAAVELAVAILSLVNHPTNSKKDVVWMPPERMPVLEPKNWKRLVKISKQELEDEPGEYIFKITNNSTYQLGVVKVRFSFSEEGGRTAKKRSFVGTFVINLPSGESCDVWPASDDIPEGVDFWRVIWHQATIAELTGYDFELIY